MDAEISNGRATATLRILRAAILFVLFVQLLGIGGELILLEHYEGIWQKIPLILIAVSIAALAVQLIIRRGVLIRIVRLIMLLCVGGGCLGLYLHYQGNAEFELEMYPSRQGMELFWESLSGATPALAPGALIAVGLLGLLYTFRHPSTQRNQFN